MSSDINIWLRKSSVFAIGICIVSQAQAQEQPSAPAGSSTVEERVEATGSAGDIVVTARRREERLQDVPISVVAISGDRLAERNVANLADLQNAFAGVKIEAQNNRTTSPQISIRGQRQFGVLEAQDPPTAFYFADAPVAPIQGFNSAMYDLSSLQVLKGPQGTLFGRNTTGGAVLVVPAKPTDEFEGQVTARAGNYDTYGLQGYVNIPVTPNLFVRASGFFNRHSGYARYIAPTPASVGRRGYAERIADGRLSVVWRPLDGVENYFVGSYFDLKTTTNPALLVAVNPNSSLATNLPNIFSQVYVPNTGRGPRDVFGDFPSFDNVNGYQFVNTTSIELNDQLTLKNIFGFRHVEGKQQIGLVGTTLPAGNSNVGFDAENFSEELQLSGTFLDGRLLTTAGLFYSKLSAYSEAQTAALYVPASLPFPASRLSAFVNNVTNISKAAFAQGTFKITDKLAFTAGVRVTKDERKVVYLHHNTNRLSYIPTTSDPFCIVIGDNGIRLPDNACHLAVDAKFTEPTYTLSLDYHITPDILVYATRRTGYRSGGFNQRALTPAQRLPFAPEKQLDHEIGVKSTFRVDDWTVRLNAAYYRDNIKGIQKNISSVVNGVIATSVFNAAEGIVQGVEADGEISLNDAFAIGANYAFTDAGYKSYPFLVGGVVRDFSDRSFSGIPKNQVSVYARYTLPLAENIGKITLFGDFSHQDGTFASDVYQSNEQISILYTPAQIARLPAGDRAYRTRPYDLFNARINWENIGSSSVSAAFYMRNITNAAPELAANQSYEGLGNLVVSIGPPRTYGLELTYKF